MSKQLLNEAESLLLNHWEGADLLERSMERVREKYTKLCSQVVEAVTRAHPDLDANAIYITQRWNKGSIGFGRKRWPEGESNWPPGLWIENLRLEVLVDESEPPPIASIWIPPKAYKKLGKDTCALRDQLLSRANELMTPVEFDRHIVPDGTGKALISFRTLGKREVLDGINPDEGKGLIQALMTQFDLMAKLTPALDDLFGETPAP